MRVLRHLSPRGFKPPPSLSVNWGHPLARGLVFAVLFNEQSGRATDLVSKNVSGAVPGTWQVGLKGFEVKFNGSSDVASFTDIESWRPGSSDFSILVLANPANESTIMTLLGKRQSVDPFQQFRLGVNTGTDTAASAGKLFASRIENFNTVRRIVASTSSSVVDGNYHQFGVSTDQSGDTIKLFSDGVELAVDTNHLGGTWPNLTSTTFPVDVGAANGGQFFNKSIVFAYLWMRKLRIDEFFSLYMNPYNFILPQRRRVTSIPEALEIPSILSVNWKGPGVELPSFLSTSWKGPSVEIGAILSVSWFFGSLDRIGFISVNWSGVGDAAATSYKSFKHLSSDGVSEFSTTTDLSDAVSGETQTAMKLGIQNVGTEDIGATSGLELSIGEVVDNDGFNMLRIGLDTATLSCPYGLTISTSAGSGLWSSVGTRFYVITAINASGETGPSQEVSAYIRDVTRSATLRWVQIPGATGYKIYRSDVSGTYGASSLRATISSGSTLIYIDVGSATGAGTPPSANTTGGSGPTYGTVPTLSIEDINFGKLAPGQQVFFWINRIVGGGVLEVGNIRQSYLVFSEL